VRGGAHPYQEQLFSEPFNQRSLKLRELPACFFEGLLNSPGIVLGRFSDFQAVQAWVLPGGNCSFYA
jgi:hypothetical protein